jgi:hypothetical protein
MGFLQDEFRWSRQRSAWSFGGVVLLLGLPTVFLYHYGVFNEYDYWAGTVSLVVFALAEAVIFSWIFGIDKGWKEITSGADMKVPSAYKFIIKYITPLFLVCVFLGSVFSPRGGDWAGSVEGLLAGEGWHLDDGSLIRMVLNSGLRDQLAAATDPAQIEFLDDRLFYINASRVLLTAVFLAICLMVFLAERKRRAGGVSQ